MQPRPARAAAPGQHTPPTIPVDMDELKALRAAQVRAERAIKAQAAQAVQLQLEQLRAEAAQRRAQVRAALRAGAQNEVTP